MTTVNIYEAKTQLSRLLRRVRGGEEIIIADDGTPVARLVPIEAPRAPRVLGGDRGEVWIAPDAFDAMSEEDLATWYDAPLIAAAGTRPGPAPAPKKTSARRAPKARRQ